MIYKKKHLFVNDFECKKLLIYVIVSFFNKKTYKTSFKTVFHLNKFSMNIKIIYMKTSVHRNTW